VNGKREKKNKINHIRK